ncbi:MAG TPA: radical SAM protein [Nitrospinota bacterium]|nr:radical SAM protein [Nitrospinota bacterium]
MPYEPPYINLHKKGGLNRRKEQLFGLLESCTLCPRKCRVNRLEGEEGYCGAGKDLIVSSVFPHFGEEPPLVGMNGSGTIFLTHCNLLCVFCQNYDISHQGQGQKISIRDLAEHMIYLQSRGCHNINFVTPTHYISQIIAALPEAIERGLKIPLVYNCGGYDSLEVLRLLDGIIDIYMPDAKYSDKDVSAKYSNAPDYFEILKESLKEMQRQTGDLIIDERGVAQRGLLVRHLIMPNGLAGTKRILEFIAKEISKNTYVNIMDQYRPCHKAGEYQELARRIAPDEFFEAIDIAKKAGLHRGF